MTTNDNYTWNVANLSHASFQARASYRHGDDRLEELADAIDEMLESALASVATDIRKRFPEVTCDYRVDR
jgi:hypothetical protein